MVGLKVQAMAIRTQHWFRAANLLCCLWDLNCDTAYKLSCVHVWHCRDPKSQEEKASSDMYAIMKKKTRDERLKWFKSDDMPYK